MKNKRKNLQATLFAHEELYARQIPRQMVQLVVLVEALLREIAGALAIRQVEDQPRIWIRRRAHPGRA